MLNSYLLSQFMQTLPSAPNPGIPGQPAIPAALGWNACTLGPTLNYNSNISSVQNTGNWFPYSLLTAVPIANQAQPQSDGSLLIPGASGTNYGATICTAYKVNSSGQWHGKAYCLPMYIRIVFKLHMTVGAGPNGVADHPAMWADELRYVGQFGGGSLTYPGQPNGVDHHMEPDMLEFTRGALNRCNFGGIINWYDGGPQFGEFHPSGSALHAVPDLGATYHTLEILWQKGDLATGTQGSQHVFLDGVETFPVTGTPSVLTWDPWDAPNMTFPPAGSQALSFMDVSQLVMIAGATSDNSNPLQIQTWEIWQPTDSINLVN